MAQEKRKATNLKKDKGGVFSYEPILFKWMDDVPGGNNIGRAEFAICPIWANGRLKGAYITRAQQRELGYYFVKLHGDRISFNSMTHRGIVKQEPWIWLQGWCKEHKTQSCRIYVPPQSSKLIIHDLNTAGFYFE